MTAAEKRERNRFRSERWRRAHGIMPRKPASKPWLAEGVSRSTWYRRGGRLRARSGRPFKAESNNGSNITIKRGTSRAYILARLERDAVQLQAELAEVARCQAVAAAIIGEMMAYTKSH
jgi:hypothetical protein